MLNDNAFQAAVAASFDAETAVERELVLRLASLLWRLRRVTAIDTGFIETPSEPDIAPDLDGGAPANERAAAASLENHTSLHDFDDKGHNDTPNSEIARRFLQLDSNGFDRLRRCETALFATQATRVFVIGWIEIAIRDVSSARKLFFRLPLSGPDPRAAAHGLIGTFFVKNNPYKVGPPVSGNLRHLAERVNE